ncbi:MAG: NAD(P)H-dependent flavin oxidoreductase [Gaiellaceae bacterium]
MLDPPSVVLAPLAGGPSTPELAAAVSNAGGLGFVAAGYLAAEELAARIEQARRLTHGPLGVNVFVLERADVDGEAVAAYARELEPDARRLGVELGEPRFDDDELAAKVEAASGAVEVLSTTFGCLPPAIVSSVRSAGTSVWATVTSPTEARAAQDAGVDALVVQGAEAGGHGGSWDDAGEPVPLRDLLRAVRAAVDLPLIAAGGIADGRAAAAALEAGAVAVQAGTAFLLAPEAATSEPHRRALAARRHTALTRAFTGRRARGIANEFMRRHPEAPSAYPHINHLTAPLRAAARAAGDAESINLWAGVNHDRAEARPAAEIVARLQA